MCDYGLHHVAMLNDEKVSHGNETVSGVQVSQVR